MPACMHACMPACVHVDVAAVLVLGEFSVRSSLLGLHIYSVTVFCFGRCICLSVVCLSRIISKKLSEIRAKFIHICRKLGSESKNMTTHFALEVAK